MIYILKMIDIRHIYAEKGCDNSYRVYNRYKDIRIREDSLL